MSTMTEGLARPSENMEPCSCHLTRARQVPLVIKPDVTIRDVVASVDPGHQIDLEDATNELGGTTYEPDQFPGLIYKVKGTKVTMLVFSNGKLVCAGACSEEDAEKAVNELYKTLTKKGLVPELFDPTV